jgi:hypothetical protein
MFDFWDLCARLAHPESLAMRDTQHCPAGGAKIYISFSQKSGYFVVPDFGDLGFTMRANRPDIFFL